MGEAYAKRKKGIYEHRKGERVGERYTRIHNEIVRGGGGERERERNQ